MKVCAIIVTYGDRFQYLSEVVDACLREGVEKVIIIDNNSSFNSKEKLKKLEQKEKKIQVIHLDENMGSAGGYRRGLEEAYKCADCEYIWLLDDDNKPARGSLRKYLDFLHRLKKSGKPIGALVGFRTSRPQYLRVVKNCDASHLLEPQNSFLGFHIFYYWKKLFDRFFLLLLQKKKRCEFIKVPTAPYGGLFFEKKLLKKIGFPDETYFLYEDDTDFTYRITQSGYDIYLIPEIKVVDLDEYWCRKINFKAHPYFFGSIERFYYFVRNKLYFQRKYRVTNSGIFNLNKGIYFLRMFLLSLIFGKMGRFHIFRRAVKDALENNMKKKKYKILFISHVLDKSGAPRSLLMLIQYLPKKNLDLHFLALRRDDLEEEFERVVGKSPIIITRKPPSNKFLKLIERLLTIPKLIYYIWSINPDLVFINSAANSRAIFFSKLLGYKTYVFVREFEEMFVSLANFRKRFIKLADKVFVTNKFQRMWIEGDIKYNGEIKVIPNGIDIQKVKELEIEEPERSFLEFVNKFSFIVANVGYMSLRKGWDYFLEVIKFLRRNEDIGFVIIGDFVKDSEKKFFLKELEKENLKDRVFITGFVKNIFKYLKYCDVVAITSRSEAFPRVALESMSIGKPVIFFDVGGIKAMFPPEYKYKVEPFDVKQYAEFILEIKSMQSNKEMKLEKQKLRERSLLFDIREISKKFYREIIK